MSKENPQQGSKLYTYDHKLKVIREKATMEKPELGIEGSKYDFPHGWDIDEYREDLKTYEQHLASLKQYPAPNFPDSFAGRDLELEKDFRVTMGYWFNKKWNASMNGSDGEINQWVNEGEKSTQIAVPIIEQQQKPKIVCLCGSTKFMDAFIKANRDETISGKIVLSVGTFGHMEGMDMNSQLKKDLDELHKRKIDLADEVFVLNVGGYIGESTRSEIQYAENIGKHIKYLEP